jgi:hypothetical protein
MKKPRRAGNTRDHTAGNDADRAARRRAMAASESAPPFWLYWPSLIDASSMQAGAPDS